MIAGLSQIGIDRSMALVRKGALVVVDERLVPHPPEGLHDLHILPITERAIAIGSPRVANIIALGALARLSGVIDLDTLKEAVRLETPKKFADLNLAAVDEGFSLVVKSRESAHA